MSTGRILRSNAPSEVVVDAYRWAFFVPPKGLREGMGVTGKARRDHKWSEVNLADATMAARLEHNANSLIQKMESQGRGPGTGFIIFLTVSSDPNGGTESLLGLDEFTTGRLSGKSEQAPMLKHYSKIIASRLETLGFECQTTDA